MLPTAPTDSPDPEEEVHYTASLKPKKGTTVMCYRCGGAHLATQCKYMQGHNLLLMQEEGSFCSGLPVKTTVTIAPEARTGWESGQKHPLHG